MSIDRRMQAKRREILRIAAEHGARNVRVFGSAARAESDPDSDVAFLVTVQLVSGDFSLNHERGLASFDGKTC